MTGIRVEAYRQQVASVAAQILPHLLVINADDQVPGDRIPQDLDMWVDMSVLIAEAIICRAQEARTPDWVVGP